MGFKLKGQSLNKLKLELGFGNSLFWLFQLYILPISPILIYLCLQSVEEIQGFSKFHYYTTLTKEGQWKWRGVLQVN